MQNRRGVQTRAVRSAIGKAVIGDDGIASSGRAAKPATASGAVNGHSEAHRPAGPDASACGDISLFSPQHPAARERESNQFGLPSSSGSSPISPQSARSATSRGRNTSPFGSLASSDSDRLRLSGCSGGPLMVDTSINDTTGACQGSGSGSGSLLDVTPAASESFGGTSSNLGSLPREARDATGSAEFSDQAEQAPEEGTHIESRSDAGGSTSCCGSLHHPQSGLRSSLFGKPGLHSSTAQDPATGQGGRLRACSILPVQRLACMQLLQSFGCQ